MLDNIIEPQQKDANLKDYESLYNSFSWDDINSEFSWSITNKINIAHEAIDRHAENPEKADKNCLVYSYKERKKNITFREMRTLSNKFANILRSIGIIKGDRVFLFLPRCPELYIALVGCAKIGAIIVPLYSDFMEEAVKERMLDGSGKLLITSTRHRIRVPNEELPALEHIIVIKDVEHEVTEGDVLWDDAMDKTS